MTVTGIIEIVKNNLILMILWSLFIYVLGILTEMYIIRLFTK